MQGKNPALLTYEEVWKVERLLIQVINEDSRALFGERPHFKHADQEAMHSKSLQAAEKVRFKAVQTKE